MPEKIDRVVYVMNSKTCKFLEDYPKLTPQVLGYFGDYYKACKKAGKELRKKINDLIDQHAVK
jgi:hypothetical protein